MANHTTEVEEERFGYIYCLSNPSFAGIYTVGHTERDPIECTHSDFVPTAFTVEFAKLVKSPEKKVANVFDTMDDNKCRVNPRGKFFRCDISKIQTIFESYTGTQYQPAGDCNENNEHDINIDIDEDNDAVDGDVDDDEEINEPGVERSRHTYRKLITRFRDGQLIRHSIHRPDGEIDVWEAAYVRISNGIFREGIYYKSMSDFTRKHYESADMKKIYCNAWFECKSVVDNMWIRARNLPLISC